MSDDLIPKRLELLLATVPKLSRVAFLMDSTNSNHVSAARAIQAAGLKLRVAMLPKDARTPPEIETAFSAMARENAGAVVVFLNPLFQQQRSQIAALSAKHRLSCMTPDRIYAEAGCLMSYRPARSRFCGAQRPKADFRRRMQIGRKSHWSGAAVFRRENADTALLPDASWRQALRDRQGDGIAVYQTLRRAGTSRVSCLPSADRRRPAMQVPNRDSRASEKLR